MNARAFVLPFSALVAIACTEHDPELGRIGGPMPAYEAGSPYACSLDGGVDQTCELPTADSPGAELPCDVANVLGPLDGPVEDRRCHRCHGDPLDNGAPIPLITWHDTQDHYPAPNGELVWKWMYKWVCTDVMPYCAGGTCGDFDPIVKPLTLDQKATLLKWLECPQPVFDTTTCP